VYTVWESVVCVHCVGKCIVCFDLWGRKSIVCVYCVWRSIVCIMCGEVYSVYTVLGSLLCVYCVGKSSACVLCGEG